MPRLRKRYWAYDVPEYTHDCRRCKFLGNAFADSKIVDLYYCGPGKRDDGTVLVRFGNGGPEYSSMPLSVALRHSNNQFGEPYRKAITRGVRTGAIKPHKLARAIRMWDD